MSDDAELLRCYALERSEEAFATLLQRHLSLVYQAALRRTNGQAQLAEEVSQTVFLTLAQNAGRLQEHAVLAGWLYVTTRHVAANTMRTEQRRRAREQAVVSLQDVDQSASAEVEWQRVRPELDAMMDALGETDRNAVLLRYFENRPYAEIAGAPRVSEDAARMRVDRALEKLRALLARRGVTSTATALGGLLAAQSAVAAPAGLATAATGSVLAGAAVVANTAGTAGLITFMTTNKIVMGIAAAVALVAGGTAVHEHQKAARTELSLAAMTREMTGLRNRLAATEAETNTLAHKRQEEPAASAGVTAQPAAGPAGAHDRCGQSAGRFLAADARRVGGEDGHSLCQSGIRAAGVGTDGARNAGALRCTLQAPGPVRFSNPGVRITEARTAARLHRSICRGARQRGFNQ